MKGHDKKNPRKLIAVHRLMNGLLQVDLAQAVGVSQQKISRIERNVMDPTPAVATKIASALETDAASLFPEVFCDAPRGGR